MYQFRPYPQFSWSISRHRTMLECIRRYFYRYYASHNGWRGDTPEEARQACLHKQLTTLYAVLGIAIHNLARECVTLCQAGKPTLSYETLIQRVRAELNAVCLSSYDRGAFLRNPTRSPMLQDVWIHGQRDEATVERVRERAYACARSLADYPLWAELPHCSAEGILVVDALTAWSFEGVTVFAAPDLIYLPQPTRVVIGDRKTGGSAEDDHMPQLATYALFARDYLHLPFREGAWQGRVMDLQSGEDLWYDISAADIASAKQRVRESIAAMRGYMADPEANAPLPRDAFPILPPAKRSVCLGCPFHPLCGQELAETGWGRFDGVESENDSLAPIP